METNIELFCKSLPSQPNHGEVVSKLISDTQDFEVGNVRFIAEEIIDGVLEEELFSDEFTLGCFNPEFIARNLNLNVNLVKACQKVEAYEAIGMALKDMPYNQRLAFAREYANADGYGHHFNSYDGSEEEITFSGKTYFVFDNR